MFDDLIADLKKGLNNFEENKQECMDSLGSSLKSNVESFTPVDTGKLKKSYRLKKTDDTVTLTSDTDYAVYVNDGHALKDGTFVPGKHMLEKGMSRMPVTINQEVNKLLKNTKIF